MNPVAKRWITGVCVGMCLPVAYLLVRGYVHRNDKYARTAQLAGIDVDTWAEVNRFYDHAAQTHTLSPEELRQANRLLANRNMEVRMRTISGLGCCNDPVTAPDALRMIRTKLSDPDSVIRRKCLMNLRKLNDPDIGKEAAVLVADPDKMVRDTAREFADESGGSATK
jgi:HEAT repeat protein